MTTNTPNSLHILDDDLLTPVNSEQHSNGADIGTLLDDATPLVVDTICRHRGLSGSENSFLSSDTFLKSKIWKNRLYIRRMQRTLNFKTIHSQLFPRLTNEQMAFIFYHIKSPSEPNWDEWDVSDDTKEYVFNRIKELYLANH